MKGRRPFFRNERELVNFLVEELRSIKEYKEVRHSVNLAGFKPNKYWAKWYGEHSPILQPEIDLLTVSQTSEISGIEVKYIVMKKTRSGREKISESYYAGIEQALGMLGLGVDRAILWHFFDENVSLDIMSKYVSACYRMIFLLNLPIGYSAYLLEKPSIRIPDKNVVLRPVKPLITPLYTPYYQMEIRKEEYRRRDWWKYFLYQSQRNPLFDVALIRDAVEQTREFIRLMLKIPAK